MNTHPSLLSRIRNVHEISCRTTSSLPNINPNDFWVLNVLRAHVQMYCRRVQNGERKIRRLWITDAGVWGQRFYGVGPQRAAGKNRRFFIASFTHRGLTCIGVNECHEEKHNRNRNASESFADTVLFRNRSGSGRMRCPPVSAYPKPHYETSLTPR